MPAHLHAKCTKECLKWYEQLEWNVLEKQHQRPNKEFVLFMLRDFFIHYICIFFGHLKSGTKPVRKNTSFLVLDFFFLDEWIWVNEYEIIMWQSDHLLCNLASFTLLTSILITTVTDFSPEWAYCINKMHYFAVVTAWKNHIINIWSTIWIVQLTNMTMHEPYAHTVSIKCIQRQSFPFFIFTILI